MLTGAAADMSVLRPRCAKPFAWLHACQSVPAVQGINNFCRTSVDQKRFKGGRRGGAVG